MIIYLFFLIIAALISYCKNEKFGNFIIILLLFFTVFRNETVGLDTYNYVHGGYTEWAAGMRTNELLYKWLSSFVDSEGSQFLLIVFGCITFGGIYVASKKWLIPPIFAVFFFILFEYYNLSLNIARQYAAAGFLLIAYSFLLDKGRRRFFFFLFVLLAAGLHSSSLLFSLTYFCRFVDFSKINKIILTLFILVFFILCNFVLKDYYIQIAQAAVITGDMEVYSRYFDQTEDYGLSLGGAIIAFVNLFTSIFIFLSISGDKTQRGRILTSLFFISIIFDVFFANLYGNIGRLRYSIDIINIIAYSWYFLYVRHNKLIKTSVALVMCVFYGYSLVYSLLGPDKAYSTVPYELCF